MDLRECDVMSSILHKVADEEGRTTEEKNYILKAACLLDCFKRRYSKDNLDFQGWPIEHYNVGMLKKALSNEKLSDDDEVIVLEDDGMAYGAKNGPCTRN